MTQKGSDQISFVTVKHGTYIILFNSLPTLKEETNLGRLIQSDDGFYYWFPCDFEGGCISNWVLKVIYDKVEELNKEWNQIIENEFKKDSNS